MKLIKYISFYNVVIIQSYFLNLYYNDDYFIIT